jgi:hypothetical protein
MRPIATDFGGTERRRSHLKILLGSVIGFIHYGQLKRCQVQSSLRLLNFSFRYSFVWRGFDEKKVKQYVRQCSVITSRYSFYVIHPVVYFAHKQ